MKIIVLQGYYVRWKILEGGNFGESMLLKLLVWKNLANLLSVDLKILHMSRLAVPAFHPRAKSMAVYSFAIDRWHTSY